MASLFLKNKLETPISWASTFYVLVATSGISLVDLE